MSYENYTPAIRLGGGLAPSGSGTFPLAKASDILMPTEERLEEYLNRVATEPNYTFSIWKLNETIDTTSFREAFNVENSISLTLSFSISGRSGSQKYYNFGVSRYNGRKDCLCFTRKDFYSANNRVDLAYYGDTNKWVSDVYRTIVIHQEITEEKLLNWLKANATLISGGGDVKPVDPTTVWEIVDEPDFSLFKENAYTDINISFTSNGTQFSIFSINRNKVADNIAYYKSDGSVVSAYNSRTGGFSDPAYKIVTFHEPITNETLSNWLNVNARLISSGKPSDEPESGDTTSSLEMPIIKFVNAIFSHAAYQDEGNPQGYVSEEYPLKLTVEVIGGTLQAGDELQVCVRRTYHTREKNLSGEIYKRRKQKLRRFAWRTITEENLNDRFLSVTLFRDDCKNVWSCLFHNDRTSFDRLSALYLRIRRPVGDLQQNESGMTVDAKFSNVVTVWKSYALDGKLSIK